jgi:hypothetical protein
MKPPALDTTWRYGKAYRKQLRRPPRPKTGAGAHSPHAGLMQYIPNADYFARAQVNGKAIRASAVTSNYRYMRGKGFFGQARATNTSRSGSGRSEQRSLAEKELPPGGAEFGLWLRGSSVTDPLRGMRPSRALPQAKLGATHVSITKCHSTSLQPSQPLGNDDYRARTYSPDGRIKYSLQRGGLA